MSTHFHSLSFCDRVSVPWLQAKASFSNVCVYVAMRGIEVCVSVQNKKLDLQHGLKKEGLFTGNLKSFYRREGESEMRFACLLFVNAEI